MAVLPNASRAEVWAYSMRDNTDPISVTKPELRAAVDAADQFIKDKAAEIEEKLGTKVPPPAPNPKKANVVHERLSCETKDRSDWPRQHEWICRKLENYDSVLTPIFAEITSETEVSEAK